MIRVSGSQVEAWIDADEVVRIAEVLDAITQLFDEHRLFSPRLQLRLNDVENTSDTGMVEMHINHNGEGEPPYYALIYDSPADDPRAAFMLHSEDLRGLADRLRQIDVDQGLPSKLVLEYDFADADDARRPSIDIERMATPAGKYLATAHLWFDRLDHFPSIIDHN